MPEKKTPPAGFSAEEWEGWSRFTKDAKEVAAAVGCTYDTALLVLALNEVVGGLEEIRDALGRKGPPDEPWRG